MKERAMQRVSMILLQYINFEWLGDDCLRVRDDIEMLASNEN